DEQEVGVWDLLDDEGHCPQKRQVIFFWAQIGHTYDPPGRLSRQVRDRIVHTRVAHKVRNVPDSPGGYTELAARPFCQRLTDRNDPAGILYGQTVDPGRA